MKKLIQFLLFLIFLSPFTASFAQQDAQFSQYMFNGLYYNPAFAGVEGLTRFSLLSRTQWLGYEGYIDDKTTDKGFGVAPQTHILSGSSLLPFFNKSVGAGTHLVYDRRGPLVTIDANVSGSYLFRMTSGTLSIGLRAGIYNQRLDSEKYRVINEDDNIYQYLMNRGGAAQTKLDLAGGLWYKASKYYVGVSFNHLTRSKFSYGLDALRSQLSNHLFITGGYDFNVGTMIVVTPSTLIQTDLQQLTYQFGGIATYNEKFWVGLSARQSFAKKDVIKGGSTLSNDDIILLVGVNLLKNKQNNNALRIGYSFDFVTSGTRAKARTSHEILLSYIIPAPWEIVRPKVRTPRYRHDEN